MTSLGLGYCCVFYFESLLWAFGAMSQKAEMPSAHCNDLFYQHKEKKERVGGNDKKEKEKGIHIHPMPTMCWALHEVLYIFKFFGTI